MTLLLAFLPKLTRFGRLSLMCCAGGVLAGCSAPPKVWYNVAASERSYYADYGMCSDYATSIANAPFVLVRYRGAVYLAQLKRCLQDRGWVELDQRTVDSLPRLAPRMPIGTPSTAATPAPTTRELLLFGGPRHDVFLGCLTCGQVDPNSVFNEVGAFGSLVSPTSIFNRIGQYGSPVSAYSACNSVASEPPVIVDRAGNSYGRLTINRVFPGAISDSQVLAWLISACK